MLQQVRISPTPHPWLPTRVTKDCFGNGLVRNAGLRSNSFAQMPDGGLLFVPDATIIAHRDLVITLAARYGMPAVFPWRYFVTAGALMSYGIDNIDVL